MTVPITLDPLIISDFETETVGIAETATDGLADPEESFGAEAKMDGSEMNSGQPATHEGTVNGPNAEKLRNRPIHAPERR